MRHSVHDLSNSMDYQDTMKKINDYQLQNKDFMRIGMQKQVTCMILSLSLAACPS